MAPLRALADTCSHLQNVSKACLSLTSIPSTKNNLWLTLALHRAGFLSSVYRAGTEPPRPEDMISKPPERVTNRNVADMRLWLGLKYLDGQPVLSKAQVISRPSRKITATIDQLERITRGVPVKLKSGVMPGLNLGECIFVFTSRGILEVREALERKVGGTLLCRVS